MKNVNEILDKYTKGEISLEDANKALAEVGAGYRLEPDKASEGWSEAEMKEGFIPNDSPAEILPDMPDMSRRTDLAGQTVMQKTKAGIYAVTYLEDGYAFKAIKQ